ncbi:MAG: hypothetical protein IJ386_02035 [Clostridia bacterium]|nr:hypothetical protein [Clostridia bacterium]
MKLDKKSIEMLASLPDDKLWQMLSLIASASGIKLPKSKPDEKTMAGLRSAVTELSDGDIERAAKLFDSYKEGRKNG